MRAISSILLGAALIALGVSSTRALPAQAQAQLASTCAASLASPSVACNCLSNCTATSTCCGDFESFSHQILKQWSIHPPRTDVYYELLDFGQSRVPAFHKIEPALTGLSRLPTGQGALLTVRTCLLHDANQATAPGTPRKWQVKKCVSAFDVVAARAADGKLVPFTDLVPVPLKQGVRAAFADALNATAKYYASLTGDSAVNVYKAALTREPLLPGLSGTLTRRGGKYAWDPTPGRSWRLERPVFTGTTEPIEVAIPESDFSAEQVDRDYAMILDMSRGSLTSTSAVLLQVWDAKTAKWAATVDAQGERRIACELFG